MEFTNCTIIFNIYPCCNPTQQQEPPQEPPCSCCNMPFACEKMSSIKAISASPKKRKYLKTNASKPETKRIKREFKGESLNMNGFCNVDKIYHTKPETFCKHLECRAT